MNKPLVNFYARRIIKGYINIEDVPEENREDVLTQLKTIKSELDEANETPTETSSTNSDTE